MKVIEKTKKFIKEHKNVLIGAGVGGAICGFCALYGFKKGSDSVIDHMKDTGLDMTKRTLYHNVNATAASELVDGAEEVCANLGIGMNDPINVITFVQKK